MDDGWVKHYLFMISCMKVIPLMCGNQFACSMLFYSLKYHRTETGGSCER